MDEASMRRLVGAARVARLATVAPGGRPRLVPFTFVLDGDTVYSAVDEKPKRTRALARLRDVERDPRVTVLVDHYDDDWSRLWWVRADLEHVAQPPQSLLEELADRLARTVPQYADKPFHRVLVCRITRITGWAAAEG